MSSSAPMIPGETGVTVSKGEAADWSDWWRRRLEQDFTDARASESICPGLTLGEHWELARRALSDMTDRPASAVDSASPAQDSLHVVTGRLDELQSSVDSVREYLLRAIERSDRSAAIIAGLETENRALKRHEAERKLEPLLKAVISLYDDLRSVVRHSQSRASANEPPEPDLLPSLLVFERQTLEVLLRSRVESFEPLAGEPFDAVKQEAWETVEAKGPEQDMRIAEVLRLGFEFDGRVIRPAAVKVYRYPAEAASERS